MSEFRDRSRRSPKPVARHGRLKRSAAWKTLLSLVGAALAVVLVAGSAVAAISVYQLRANLKTEVIEADKKPVPNIAEIEGGFNIFIVGSDTRAGQGGIGGAHETGTLNDVNMLLHVAEDRKSATLVSFPRDLIVPIPACSNGGPATGLPINETLAMGGLNCTVKTVQQLTGLEIQFAGLITFKGVIEMSNAVGGVEVCTNGPINDPKADLYIDSAGTHTLQGKDALAFLRSRHGVGDGSDLGRISSQQVFLSSLVRKMQSNDTFSDFGKLYALAQAATKNMTLSENFSQLDTLVSVALALKNIPLKNIAMVQYPGVTGGTGIYANKVQPLQTQAAALFAAIKADKPIELDDNALGGSYGQVLDPNAPKPSDSPQPTESATPGATPPPLSGDDDGDAVLVPGVKGQTASQYTCAAAN